jgi:hypothetical protein
MIPGGRRMGWPGERGKNIGVHFTASTTDATCEGFTTVQVFSFTYLLEA